VFDTTSPFHPKEHIAAPANHPMTLEVFELGRKLFMDPRLSAKNEMSCATCHIVEHGFAEPRARALDNGELRNTPTLYNRAYGKTFGWDGKAATLEEQVLMPIANEKEMALPLPEAVARLRADPDYRAAFDKVLGAEASEALLSRALATYVRGITLGDSPMDRFVRAKKNSLTRDEKAGFWIYESKGKCWRCHVPPNFADEKFHNTGVAVVDGVPKDVGRFAITGVESDRGAFKTPTLRGLVFTAPYMHDGSLATLEQVVEFYRRGGNKNRWLSNLMEPLDLNDEEARVLVTFLRMLSRRETDGDGTGADGKLAESRQAYVRPADSAQLASKPTSAPEALKPADDKPASK
jgi:cytochrome c peroxidase